MSLDLDAIKARADAASKGPWISATDTGRKNGVSLIGATADRGTGKAIAVLAAPDVRQRAVDADFVAHARDDVPALVAEVGRLRAALKRIRDEELATVEDYAAACAGDRLTEFPDAVVIAAAALELKP